MRSADQSSWLNRAAFAAFAAHLAQPPEAARATWNIDEAGQEVWRRVVAAVLNCPTERDFDAMTKGRAPSPARAERSVKRSLFRRRFLRLSSSL